MYQEDFDLGQKIARQCKKMDSSALAAAIDRELSTSSAYVDRFDSEDGEIGLIEAAITTFQGYLHAGGSLDLGRGWQLAQQQDNSTPGDA